MEKIKQALDRARISSTTKLDEGQNRKELRRAPSLDVTSKITYSKTKTVQISENELRDKRVITGETNDSISDQYKVLRTHVLQRLKANRWNSLAVTSPNEGCGKTLTSINLAISLAKEVNHSVLLVDMDLRCPSIQRYFFTDEQQYGLSDYLTEGLELSDVLFNPGLERLVVLPGNKSIPNSSEMLSSPKMVGLVEELKNRYPNRIVIFDMPPLLLCDDMIVFSTYVDAAMLVVEEGRTHKADLQRAYDLIGSGNIIGTVLNKSLDNAAKNNYYKYTR